MKKFLLFAVAALLASAQSMATDLVLKPGTTPRTKDFAHSKAISARNLVAPKGDTQEEADSLVFAYCDAPYTALGYGASYPTYAGCAIQIASTNMAKLAGAKLVALDIATGTGATDVTIFATKKLTAMGDSYTKSVKHIEGELEWERVLFDEPYQVTGSEGNIYVGFYAKLNANSYPIGVDYIPTTNTKADLAISSSTETRMSTEHLGESYGSVTVRAVFAGDNLPVNVVETYGIALQGTAYRVVKPNEESNMYVALKNAGARTIKNIELQYTLGNEDAVNLPITLDEPLKSGEGTELELTISYPGEGNNIPAKVAITKVNGENPAEGSITEASDTFLAIENGFFRNHYEEEVTGTWCGYCPLGIVGMDYMAETYEDTFIGVAIHSGDEFSDSSFSKLMNQKFSGYVPDGIANRDSYYNAQPSKNNLTLIYPMVTNTPAMAELTAELKYANAEQTQVKVTTKSKFAFDLTDGNNYAVGYVLTEDGLPGKQTNYYSGGGQGAMGGWEKKGSTVDWIYTLVARKLYGDLLGYADSFPTEMTKNTEYETVNVIDLPTNSKTGELTVVPENCTLAVYVVNRLTGCIENANKVKFTEISAVNGINTTAAERTISNVYTIDGRNIGNTMPSQSGIYVIRYTDGTATKTMVK